MKDRRNGFERRNQDQDYLMTELEVAKLARVSVNTVRYWRQTGIIPFVKVGRHPRVWWSAFQTVFHSPSILGALERNSDSGKIAKVVGRQRRKSDVTS
jgi:excisionase family DNA binding protein